MPRSLAGTLIPPGTHPDARLLLIARGVRAFGDGYVSLLLPYYLTLLGYSALQIGALVTATLLGSGVMTLGVGFIAHRFRQRTLLKVATGMMIGTGIAFVVTTEFWPLLLIAAVGTINSSAGDTSIFRPLEHTALTSTVAAEHRTALFASYSLVGYLVGAFGAQAAALPALAEHWFALDAKNAVRLMFLLYGVLGLACLCLYRRLTPAIEATEAARSAALGKSKRIVYTLAIVFSLDSFAGGFTVQSLVALWLFQHFQLSIVTASAVFFWTGILGALSMLVSAPLARRFGLINTMVFTHLPSSVFLMLVPFMPNLPLALTFLMLNRALQSMDVPARSSYVMAVVSPAERPAAASVTAVPRTFAGAVSPLLSGWLLGLSTFGWPFVICGTLKITYDLLLLTMFHRVRPAEESRGP